MNTTLDREPLVSRRQAAEYLGVKEQTLAVWNSTGRYGLRCFKVGKLAKYRLSDLDKWLAKYASCGVAS